MKLKIQDDTKARLARYGPNKLFGDPDRRTNERNDEVLIRLFDSVWSQILERAILSSEQCQPEKALRRLSTNEKRYFDSNQEHREFRLDEQNMEFIAQLKPVGVEEFELTQLWRLSSTDINPKTLYITFDTVEEREKFRDIASKLGWNDEQLGLQLVRDFMDKLQRR